MGISAEHFDRIAAHVPIGRDPAAVRLRVEAMERLLEGLITIPGLDRKIGLDVLANLVPFFGDLVTTLMGAWIVWEGRNLGMSKWQVARMAGNVAIDTAFGAIPFVGAVPDFLFRSNTRNLRLIRRHLDRHHPATAIVEGRVMR